MTTVNSNSIFPGNLFISTATLPVNVVEGLKCELNTGQMVRATVIEAGLNGAILEVNRQRYLAQGEQELRVGQKLNLQVLQTQPQLEFKVLSDSLNDRLSQALPLLARSFDWSQLVGQLRQQLGQSPQLQSAEKVYNQLQQIFNPTTGVPVSLKESMAFITTQLQQLTTFVETPLANNLLPAQPLSLPVLQVSQQLPPFALSKTITSLINNLQTQLSLLPKPGQAQAKQVDQTLPKVWYVETRNLLAPLQQGLELPQLLIPQRQLLVTVLNQIRQHPRVSSQLAGEVERILIKMDKQVAQDLSLPLRRTKTLSKEGFAVTPKQNFIQPLPRSVKETGAKAGGSLIQLSAEIKQVIEQVPQVQEQKQSIAPELLGRLEGLLGRLQKLPQAAGDVPVLLPGVEVIVSQLEQLVAQRPAVPQSGQLGMLSQLFGFHLETELLQGRKKAALASLKLSLLGLQKDLGEDVAEPLRRLELFQLCKAKLAEEQVQFLPLPFNELEEGYLLSERQSRADDNDLSGSPLQMSLSLRLSALGNIRIDMLYEKEGLHLRLACEDREKMDYLQNCIDELKESLQAIELQGVSFSADAQLPARQLQERLLPDLPNMLDARI